MGISGAGCALGEHHVNAERADEERREVGTATQRVATVDVETLDIQPVTQRYSRLDTHRWRLEQTATGESIEFDVDEFGLVIDYPERFRRVD